MDAVSDAVALAQCLVSYDTVNPPGREAACADYLRSLLAQANFQVQAYAHAPGRTSLVARAGRLGAPRALCFVGHMDTVPLGRSPWTQEPFAARIVDGRLYGRGACDMKSGVAAFVTAAMRAVATLPDDAELVLLLVAGEETGCEGSLYLATLGLPLDHFTGVIVGEPTDNFPRVGHKGALWLQAAIKGVAAHGSNPAAGENAVRKGAEAVMRLDHFCSLMRPHPVLGQPTLNIGTFSGGQNVNSVPDWAEIGLDFRTTPGVEHAEYQDRVKTLLAPHLHGLSVLISMGHVYTPPDNPWVRGVFDVVQDETGQPPAARIAGYFTDASALKPVFRDAPILILGPGRPEEMHQTDEYCEVARIDQAVRIYERVIAQTLAGTAATSVVGEAARA